MGAESGMLPATLLAAGGLAMFAYARLASGSVAGAWIAALIWVIWLARDDRAPAAVAFLIALPLALRSLHALIAARRAQHVLAVGGLGGIVAAGGDPRAALIACAAVAAVLLVGVGRWRHRATLLRLGAAAVMAIVVVAMFERLPWPSPALSPEAHERLWTFRTLGPAAVVLAAVGAWRGWRVANWPVTAAMLVLAVAGLVLPIVVGQTGAFAPLAACGVAVLAAVALASFQRPSHARLAGVAAVALLALEIVWVRVGVVPPPVERVQMDVGEDASVRSLPPFPGERATYDVRWTGAGLSLPVARATLETWSGDADASYRLVARIEPNAWVRAWWDTQYEYETTASADLSPQTHVEVERRAGNDVKESVFDYAGMAGAARSLKAEAAGAHDRGSTGQLDHAGPGHLQDGLTVLHALRRVRWQAGDDLTRPIVQGDRRYTLAVDRVHEDVDPAEAGAPARRLDLRVLPDNDRGVPLEITMWLGRDHRRVPLRADTTGPFGRVRLDLVAYEDHGPGPRDRGASR